MRGSFTTVLGPVLMIGLSATSAVAQWITLRTPGIPRTAIGEVDRSAPPPRTSDGTPDFSGLWGWQPGRYFGTVAADLKPDEIAPWAQDLRARRMEAYGKDDPAMYDCLPQGPRMNMHAPLPVKLVQTPQLLLMLSEDLTYRQIFLDGRSLPVDPDPSFMGYSVGRWEGDTLVVDTIGFKDRTWLDFSGLPHTEALHIVERIRRTTFGHLEIEETITDPAVFTRPVTVRLGAQYVPDTELLEFICAENEKSRAHMVGVASDLIRRDREMAVTVSPEILARYVGTYDFRIPENPSTPMLFELTLVGGQLLAGGAPVIPLSQTTFGGPFGRFEVVLDGQGVASHLLVRVAEGELKAVRLTPPPR
jgi:hypothetical protein